MVITPGANERRHIGLNFLAIFAVRRGSGLARPSIYTGNGFADRLAAIIEESSLAVMPRISSFFLARIGIQIHRNSVNAHLCSLPGMAG